MATTLIPEILHSRLQRAKSVMRLRRADGPCLLKWAQSSLWEAPLRHISAQGGDLLLSTPCRRPSLSRLTVCSEPARITIALESPRTRRSALHAVADAGGHGGPPSRWCLSADKSRSVDSTGHVRMFSRKDRGLTPAALSGVVSLMGEFGGHHTYFLTSCQARGISGHGESCRSESFVQDIEERLGLLLRKSKPGPKTRKERGRR